MNIIDMTFKINAIFPRGEDRLNSENESVPIDKKKQIIIIIHKKISIPTCLLDKIKKAIIVPSANAKEIIENTRHTMLTISLYAPLFLGSLPKNSKSPRLFLFIKRF